MIKDSVGIEPNVVSSPGDTMIDLLEERGWSQSEFAERTGYTPKHVNLLIRGRASISEDTAFRLEKVLGGTARLWLSREAGYREALGRKKERAILEAQSDWLGELPLAHMKKYGWAAMEADSADQVSECLAFFGVASVDIWREMYMDLLSRAAFRTSAARPLDVGAVATWLRQGERVATALQCDAFDKLKLREMLGELRKFTNEADPQAFVPRLTEACAAVGVAVVFAPAPKGCPVTGATKWLTRDKALLMLNFRYKSNDRLWFAFYHQAGHLLLHGKKMTFIETLGGMSGDDEEQADAFARDVLVPPEQATFLPYLAHTYDDVEAFSESIGIAPGIVVGRMQHDGVLPRNYLNKLKVRYQWDAD